MTKPAAKLARRGMEETLQIGVETLRRRKGSEELGRCWLQMADQRLAINNVHSPPRWHIDW